MCHEKILTFSNREVPWIPWGEIWMCCLSLEGKRSVAIILESLLQKKNPGRSDFGCDHQHCHDSLYSSLVSSPIWTARSPRCSLWCVVILFQATAKWHNSFIPSSFVALGLPWGPQQLVSSPNENSSQVCVKPSGRSDQRHLIFFS